MGFCGLENNGGAPIAGQAQGLCPYQSQSAELEPISGERLWRAIQATFTTEATHPIPAGVTPPPAKWDSEFRRMVKDVGMDSLSLGEASMLIRKFLDPVLQEEPPGEWDPGGKSWDEIA